MKEKIDQNKMLNDFFDMELDSADEEDEEDKNTSLLKKVAKKNTRVEKVIF